MVISILLESKMKRPLLSVFAGLLFLAHTNADLMYNTVYKSFEWRSRDGKAKVRPRGPLNLMLGLLANKSGIVYNKRLFSPDIEVTYEINMANSEQPYKRIYNRDAAVSNDAFYSTMLNFFPSSGGRISIAMVRDDSFFNVLSSKRSKDKGGDESRERSIRFMAALTAMALGVNIEYESKLSGKKNKHVIVKTPTEIKIEGHKLKQVCNALEFFSSAQNELDESMSSMENFARSKIFLIQAFLTHCLDTKEDTETFLSNVYDLVKNTNVYNNCFVSAEKEEEVDYELLKEVVKINGIFPFSATNQPPSNITVPQYDRTAEKFLKDQFSDCVEVSLLEFMCCILYDTNRMEYSTENISNDAERLKEFFEKHNTVFAFTLECRKDWLRVVADIEKHVEYWKINENHNNAKNDLKPGLINLMSVLESICCLIQEKTPGKSNYIGIWKRIAREMHPTETALLEGEISAGMVKKPSDYGKIRKAFEDGFISVLSALSKKNIAVEFRNMNVLERSGSNKTWDVFGSIFMTIKIAEGISAVIELRHRMRHAELLLVKSPLVITRQTIKDIAERADKYMNAASLVELLIGKYASICISTSSKYDTYYEDVRRCIQNNNIDDVFLHGPLDTDSHKMQLLDVLFSYLREKATPRLAQLGINIVSNSNLNDGSVINKYESFIELFGCVKDRFSELTRSCHIAKYLMLWEASANGCLNVVCYYIKEHEYCVNMIPTPIHIIFLMIKHSRADEMSTIQRIYGSDADFFAAEGFQAATKACNQEYATLFLGKTDISYLANCKHSILCEETIDYFQEWIDNPEVDTETLEKIYYWHFYTKGHYKSESLIHLIEKTHRRLHIDFIYDCILKYPGCFVVIRFYKFLLEMAVRENIKVRNDVLWMAGLFGSYFSDDLDFTRRGGFQDINDRIRNVVSKNLVYRRVALEESYITFRLDIYIYTYLIAQFHGNHAQVAKDYISNATRILEEGKRCNTSIKLTFWVFLAADAIVVTFFALSVWRSIRKP